MKFIRYCVRLIIMKTSVRCSLRLLEGQDPSSICFDHSSDRMEFYSLKFPHLVLDLKDGFVVYLSMDKKRAIIKISDIKLIVHEVVLTWVAVHLFDPRAIPGTGWIITNSILKCMQQFMHHCGFAGMNPEMIWVVVISEQFPVLFEFIMIVCIIAFISLLRKG